MKPAKKIAKKIAKPLPVYDELQIAMVKAMGLKEGDRVEIVRHWDENELGFVHGPSEDLRISIGDDYTVEGIEKDYICLSDEGAYPIFALKKIGDEIQLNDEYEVSFKDNGDIKVGCLSIPFEKLRKIYIRARDKNDAYEEEDEFIDYE
jgi:hypothetical protein